MAADCIIKSTLKKELTLVKGSGSLVPHVFSKSCDDHLEAQGISAPCCGKSHIFMWVKLLGYLYTVNNNKAYFEIQVFLLLSGCLKTFSNLVKLTKLKSFKS